MIRRVLFVAALAFAGGAAVTVPRGVVLAPIQPDVSYNVCEIPTYTYSGAFRLTLCAAWRPEL